MKYFFIIFMPIILLMGFIYSFQRKLIYFPDRQTPNRQQYGAVDMSVIGLYTEDGLYIKSWYKPAKTGMPTLLFIHGNAGHIGYRMPLIRQFLNLGYGVFLLEYRGYGGNAGNPTEIGLYQDSKAALKFLQTQGIKKNQLIVYGESLGTAIATKLVAENGACVLILQSPFTSLATLARYHYPWILMKPWDRFESLENIKKIKTPILIIHGKKDSIVPFSHGVTLYNQANQPKKIMVLGKNHNNLWDENFLPPIIDFIFTHCIKNH